MIKYIIRILFMSIKLSANTSLYMFSYGIDKIHKKREKEEYKTFYFCEIRILEINGTVNHIYSDYPCEQINDIIKLSRR